jgi:hypothetical protein
MVGLESRKGLILVVGRIERLVIDDLGSNELDKCQVGELVDDLK